MLYGSVGRLLARGQSRAIKARIGEINPTLNSAMDLLNEGRDNGTLNSWLVAPTDLTKLVGVATFDKNRLEQCAKLAQSDMANILASKVDTRVYELD